MLVFGIPHCVLRCTKRYFLLLVSRDPHIVLNYGLGSGPRGQAGARSGFRHIPLQTATLDPENKFRMTVLNGGHSVAGRNLVRIQNIQALGSRSQE